jgi:shikimate dehydrogenase
VNTAVFPVAGVIGWPIGHSKSPLIHRFWLAKLGLEGDYSRFEVHPDGLQAAVRALPALGMRGVNVTIPHKIAVMAHLDDLDDSAVAVGAVNTIKVFADGRIGGANTDMSGIIEGAAAAGVPGHEVIILGTGGAACAAVAAAVYLEADWVTIVARDTDRGAELLRKAGQQGTILPFGGPLPRSPAAALLFNATSLGMTGKPPLNFDLGFLPETATVFDAVYAPLETPLLRAARARGLSAVDGLTMLIGQAAMAFDIFFGFPPPREHDAALRELLTR